MTDENNKRRFQIENRGNEGMERGFMKINECLSFAEIMQTNFESPGEILVECKWDLIVESIAVKRNPGERFFLPTLGPLVDGRKWESAADVQSLLSD